MSKNRLLDEKGTDDFERELLSAARAEAPRDAVREAALAAARRGGGGGGTPRPRWPWIAAGAIIIGLALLIGVRPRPPTAAPVVVASVPTPIESVAVVASAEPPVAPEPVHSAAPATSAVASVVRPAPVRSAESAVQEEEPSLAAEVAALEVARSALNRGDAPGSLRALDDYDRAFPRGMMRQEAVLLRIEALANNGDTKGARALADKFLAANPKSPHAQRIRRLVGIE
jgi:hypothetical protein